MIELSLFVSFLLLEVKKKKKKIPAVPQKELPQSKTPRVSHLFFICLNWIVLPLPARREAKKASIWLFSISRGNGQREEQCRWKSFLPPMHWWKCERLCATERSHKIFEFGGERLGDSCLVRSRQHPEKGVEESGRALNTFQMPYPRQVSFITRNIEEVPGFQICESKNCHRGVSQLLLFAAADSDPLLPSPNPQLLILALGSRTVSSARMKMPIS